MSLLHRLLARSTPLAAALTVTLLPSCKSTQGSAGSDSLYASNYQPDGGYRPYASAQGGVVQSTGSTTQYGRSLPAPPPGYEMPKEEEFHAPPTPKKKTTTASKPTAKKKTTSTAAAKKKTTGARSHTVAKGDTLYGLALRYKTSVAKIKAASGISTDRLSIGQKLRIP